MAEIRIIHNPFKVKTDFIIDGNMISETSGLYKYVNTPMQDWVSEFLPILIEDSNDDELEIVFKGLQYNFDDLDREVQAFLRKNRDIEIDITFDCCVSQQHRLDELETIIREVKEKEYGCCCCLPESVNTLSYVNREKMRILILGGEDAQRHSFTDDLLDCQIIREAEKAYCYVDTDSCQMESIGITDVFFKYEGDIPFIAGKYCQTEVYELPLLAEIDNTFFSFATDAIIADDRPVIITIIKDESRPGKNELYHLLDRISKQFKVKGKGNKWRFIFVAESPESARKWLKDEFSLKPPVVYAIDDVLRIRQQILEYQDEICLVHQLAKRCDFLNQRLQMLLIELEKRVKDNKEKELLDQGEQIKDLIKKTMLVFKEPSINRGVEIDLFLHRLVCEFAENCFDIPQDLTLAYDEQTRKNSVKANRISFGSWIGRRNLTKHPMSHILLFNIKAFLKTIPNKIEQFLIESFKKDDFTIDIELDPQLLPLLEKTSLDSVIDAILDLDETSLKESAYKSVDLPNVEDLLHEVEQIHVVVCNGTEESKTPFYGGLENVIFKEFGFASIFVSEKNIGECIDAFEEHLMKMRDPLYSFYGKCIKAKNKTKEHCEITFEVRIDQLLERVESELNRIREDVVISDEEQSMVNFVNDTLFRINKLCDL